MTDSGAPVGTGSHADAPSPDGLGPSGFDPSRGAHISRCGNYRYSLWRGRGNLLTFCMLNPSTADADVDDPTIRRCMAFARREGYDGVEVVNLFAFRATSPEDMKGATEPVGQLNDRTLSEVFATCRRMGKPVVAAWGVHGVHRGRAAFVAAYAEHHGAPLMCLGKTKEGHPRHPLYVRGDQPLVPYFSDRDASLAEDAERLSPEGVAARAVADGIAKDTPA